MSKLNFFQFPIGKYCTAYEIGAKVKELTNNKRFFRDMNTDEQERIGRWVNAEAGKVYSNDVHYTLDGMDAISLPVPSNQVMLTMAVDCGLVNERWYTHHKKLDIYSARMAEMIIQSFTGILDYRIQEDMNIFFEWQLTELDWKHNDISKKYVHRRVRNLRTSGRKSLLKGATATDAALRKLREDAEDKLNNLDDSKKVRGDAILTHFPSRYVKLLRFYWKLSKVRSWYHDALVDTVYSTEKADKLVDEFTHDMIDQFFIDYSE